jgi:hypothetical protein
VSVDLVLSINNPFMSFRENFRKYSVSFYFRSCQYLFSCNVKVFVPDRHLDRLDSGVLRSRIQCGLSRTHHRRPLLVSRRRARPLVPMFGGICACLVGTYIVVFYPGIR